MQAERGHLFDDIVGKFVCFVALQGAGGNFFIGKIANCFAE